MKIKNPLLQMVVNGLLGALFGLVAGLAFGGLISLIQYFIQGEFNAYSYTPPLYTNTFLGMAFGTLVGAIMGSLVGLKKVK